MTPKKSTSLWLGMLLLCGISASAYTVVDDSGGDPAAVWGAAELARVLALMTGEEVAPPPPGAAPAEAATAVIRLGGGERSAYAPGEYHCYAEAGGALRLTGGGPEAIPAAVNAFLDSLGCRVFTVGADGEFIPRRERLDWSGLELRGQAGFAVRHFTNYYLSPTPEVNRFFARNGFNVSVRLPDGVPERFRFVGPGVHSLGFYISAGETPALDYYRPWPSRRNLFATNPEYFSLNANGERVTSMQLCFSNPDLRRLLTAHLLEQLEADGRGDGTLEVSANDVPGAFCHCQPCRALTERYGTPAGPLIDYLFEGCAEIGARYPDARIKTLAYRKGQSEIPPRVERLPANLVVIFAPIDADFAKPLDAPSNRDTLENLSSWCRIAAEVWVWYYVNLYGEGGTAPVGNLAKLAHDIRLMRELGVRGGFFEHYVGSGLGFGALQGWLIGRLFQDPEADWRELTAEFLRFYYGPAAPGVQQYLAELEKEFGSMRSELTWNPAMDALYYLTPDKLARWQAGFDRLESELAAPGDLPYLERVRMLRVMLDIATLRRYPELRRAGLTQSLELPTLIDRIKREYAAAQARTRPERHAITPEEVETLFANEILLARNEPRPLPEPFARIPAARLTRLFPAQQLKPDAEAALGVSVSSELEEVPLTMGVYDAIQRRWLLSRSLQKSEFSARPGYHFYHVGRSKVSPDSCFWLTQQWFATVPLARLYVQGDPDREWEIYVSLALDGPAYRDASGETDRVRIDQLLLIDPGAVPAGGFPGVSE